MLNNLDGTNTDARFNLFSYLYETDNMDDLLMFPPPTDNTLQEDEPESEPEPEPEIEHEEIEKEKVDNGVEESVNNENKNDNNIPEENSGPNIQYEQPNYNQNSYYNIYPPLYAAPSIAIILPYVPYNPNMTIHISYN